jgi:hypothetical protein
VDTNLLAQFAPLLTSVTEAEIRTDSTLSGRLTLSHDGALTINWTPFDHINTSARIVLVGITPGRQQAVNALAEARRQLLKGADLAMTAAAAKSTASFSGAMRGNLVSQLDHVGINRFLGIQTCASLFGVDYSATIWMRSFQPDCRAAVDANLVHYTSALRHPVFVGGENYSGQPSMTKHRLLRDYLRRHLGAEARALPGALWIPLGPRPAEALLSLAEADELERNRILDGLQHPSGANAERIAYFLGRKAKAALSVKTNPLTIDVARESLLRRLATLQAA